MASKPEHKGYGHHSHRKVRAGPRTGRTQKSSEHKLWDNLWLTPEPHKGGAAPNSQPRLENPTEV